MAIRRNLSLYLKLKYDPVDIRLLLWIYSVYPQMPAELPAELALAASPTPTFPRLTKVVQWLDHLAPSPRTLTIGTFATITLSIIAFYIYFFYYIFLIMNEHSQGKLMSSTNRTQIMDQDLFEKLNEIMDQD